MVTGQKLKVYERVGEAPPKPMNSVQEGVYYFRNMYSTLILELKKGKFRYWFRSDLRGPREPTYPLSGQYMTNGGAVILLHKEISQTNWTFMMFRGKPTLWRPGALRGWREDPRFSSYGVLYSTTDNPEEIWERKSMTK
jgi:hypothetical protein